MSVRRSLSSATVVAAGLALAVVAAAGLGWRADRLSEWSSAGLTWLAIDRGVAWFDALALGALGLGGARAAWQRWRGNRGAGPLPRGALGVVAAVTLLRMLIGWCTPTPSGPNLVLISVDTLRADRLSCYGYERPTSPAVDAQLAGAGVLFGEVVSQAPKTTPSHMTMFTGLYPSVHGVTMWEGTDERGVLNPRVHTLAEVLRNAGYDTVAFTAGGPMHRARGFDHGFQEYRHDRPLERALSWLERGRRGPFFLFFHTYDVHDPYTPPDEYIDQFAPRASGPLIEAVRALRSQAIGWEAAHKRYWDAVDRNDPASVALLSSLYDAGIRKTDDRTLTPLFGAIDRLGLRENTLVVLVSDHGEAFMEHGAFMHDDVYRETTHVPWIMRWPGVLPAGRRVSVPVELTDLMPTLLDLLHLPLPAVVQGRSVAAAARGDALAPRPVISEYSTHKAGAFQRAVRSGDERLVIPGGPARLFDLTTDRREEHDIAGERPARVAVLLGLLEQWRTECARLVPRYGPGGEGVAPDPDTLQRLKALGYVE